MDWAHIALASVAILGPYFSKAGETVAQKMSEDFYHWLKQTFKKNKDEEAQLALSELEKDPYSESHRDVFAEVLTQRANANPEFSAELQSQVQQVAATRSDIGTLVGKIIAGKVAVVNTMYGDINM